MIDGEIYRCLCYDTLFAYRYDESRPNEQTTHYVCILETGHVKVYGEHGTVGIIAIGLGAIEATEQEINKFHSLLKKRGITYNKENKKVLRRTNR